MPRLQELETDLNPFAVIVLAHLKSLETRKNPEERRNWKVRLVRRLYERGLSAEDVRQLFKFIDWMMTLPAVQNQSFWEELEHIEKEKRMPYVTSVERLGIKKGLLEGIEPCLRMKFGAEFLRILPEIRAIEDVEVLRAVLRAIESATTVDELRQIWKP